MKILRLWAQQNLWTAKKRGKRRRRGGRKEEREGRGSGKCLEGCGMGMFALRSATMDSRVPLHASRCGLICSQKTRRVRGPAAAALRTVFSERGVGESSLRGAAVLAASVAQPRGRDVPFELAAGPRQLRKLRGAAAPSKSKRALGEPKRPWV